MKKGVIIFRASVNCVWNYAYFRVIFGYIVYKNSQSRDY